MRAWIIVRAQRISGGRGWPHTAYELQSKAAMATPEGSKAGRVSNSTRL